MRKRGLTDSAGFNRYWGIGIFHTKKAPWFSLGIHLDWHTPTLDFHIGKSAIQIGRNQWEEGKRITFGTNTSSGHTDQCTCRSASALGLQDE